VLKFTSALYLGLDHPSGALRSWSGLTTGSPAALGSLPGEVAVAADLAALVGCESAALAPSTLHAFWDLSCLWLEEQVSVYVDEGAYPLGRWGAARAAARGACVATFAHHDPDALARQLRKGSRKQGRPVVLTDGFCPQCGEMAPLKDYLQLSRRSGGALVVDDTQALGIFGAGPEAKAPYGTGGGGSLRWWNLQGPEVVMVCSMAKALGTPMAFVAGTRKLIRRYEMNGQTRVHSSPVSAADISAGDHALISNQHRGDTIRRRLAHLVKVFRSRLEPVGWRPLGGLFPVQAFPVPRESDALALYAALLRLGVEPVLQAAGHDGRRRIAFLITAKHSDEDVRHAAEAWLRAVLLRPAVRPAAAGE